MGIPATLYLIPGAAGGKGQGERTKDQGLSAEKPQGAERKGEKCHRNSSARDRKWA